MSADDFFLNNNFDSGNRNFHNFPTNIVLPTTEYTVVYRIGNTSVKKLTTITAEKIDFKGLVQIRLADKDDQTKMFISTIDTNFFTQLKKEQSLHVTFTGFIENLIKIFDECQQGNLQISLIQERGKENSFLLQFYEIRSFKNLIHLCLPIQEASLPVILFYLNQTVKTLQKQNDSYAMNLKFCQDEIEKNINRIQQLQKDNEKLRFAFKEQENYVTLKNQEEINRLQESIKRLNDEKNSDEKQLKQAIVNLQNEVEHYKIENSQVVQDKTKLLKKIETLNEENCVLKSNIANLKEQSDKLHAENVSLKSFDKKRDVYVDDFKKQIQELREKIRKYEKLKSELLAEIEAEKKLCQSKRQALEMTTEELTKANDIISKQSLEITKLRKTIDWRTEVALQQETIIHDKEKLLQKQTEQLKKLQDEIRDIRGESEKFFDHLESIKTLADKIEHKYNERIRDVNEQLTS